MPPPFYVDQRLRSTGRHPLYTKYDRTRLSTKTQWQQLIDETSAANAGPPAGLVGPGEKLYVSPSDAVANLGLDVVRKQIAHKLVQDVALNVRDMLDITAEGREAGLAPHTISALLNRGQHIRFREETRKSRVELEFDQDIYLDLESGEFLVKSGEHGGSGPPNARRFPVGYVSTYANGQKVRKDADGRWRPVSGEGHARFKDMREGLQRVSSRLHELAAMGATEAAFEGGSELGKAIWNRIKLGAKRTAEEVEEAAEGMGHLIRGEKIERKHAIAISSVAIAAAGVAVQGALGGPAAAAGMAAYKVAMHVATAAVHGYLARAFTAYSGGHVLEGALEVGRMFLEKSDDKAEAPELDPNVKKLIVGVLAELSKTTGQKWSDEHLKAATERVEKSQAVDRAFPVGWVSNYADGRRMRKVGPNKWQPVGNPKPSSAARGREVHLSTDELENTLNHGKFSIISAGPSASDPHEAGLTSKSAAIQQRYKHLIADIEAKGWSYTVVHGKYDKPETSIIVLHDDHPKPEGLDRHVMIHHANESEFSQVRALAKKYHQESVIHSNQGIPELHSTEGPDEGKHISTTKEGLQRPGEGKTWTKMQGANNYFTRIRHPAAPGSLRGSTTQFSLLFDWESKHGMEDALHKSINDFKALAQARGVFAQLIDGHIRLAGDLAKAGVPGYLVPDGALSVQLALDTIPELIEAFNG